MCFNLPGRFTCHQETGLTLLQQDFESALAAIPSGYGEGVYEGLQYGVTGRKPRDGRRTSLFARALAGRDDLSFNLYRLRSGEDSLRPCEMPAEKVVAGGAPSILESRPKYPCRKRMYGANELVGNGTVRPSMVGWSSMALCVSS